MDVTVTWLWFFGSIKGCAEGGDGSLGEAERATRNGILIGKGVSVRTT